MHFSDILKCLGFWVLLVVIACSGCDTSQDDSEKQLSSVSLALSQAFAVSEIELVRLTVSGDGMETMVRELTREEFGQGDLIEFELDVPAGQYRSFAASAFMLNDEDAHYVAYEGEEVVYLEAGEEKQVDLILYGRGYISGNVYFLEQAKKEEPWLPGAPLADAVGQIFFEGSDQAYSEFAIDENGYFEIVLETRPERYDIRINTTVEKPYPWETYATIGLHEGGDRFEVSLYLFPSDNVDQPWITAMIPNQGASGDVIEVYGRGFWPDQSDRPILPFFGLASSIIQVDLDQEPNVDTNIKITVPFDVNPGDYNFYIAWKLSDTKSNYVPFTIL